MNDDTRSTSQAALAEVPLSPDVFMRDLIRELAGTLEDVVGLEEASGYISVVGQSIGSNIDDTYRHALSVEKLDRSQVVVHLLMTESEAVTGREYVAC